MPRIRSIKPEFWTSEQVVECSPNARLLFIGLWNFCDDAGRHPASLKRVKMQIFPGDPFSDEQLQQWIDELIEASLLELYSVDGKGFWQVTGWHHQRIDQPTYKYPNRDGIVECSSNKRRAVDKRAPPEGKGGERSGGESSGGEGNGRSTPLDTDWTLAVQVAKDAAKIVPVLSEEDRSLLLKAAALSQTMFNRDWLQDALNAVVEHPSRKPQSYLHGTLRSKCEELGKDFKAILRSVIVPDGVTKQLPITNGKSQ